MITGTVIRPTISVRDEHFPSKAVTEMLLQLSSNTLTAADLISERVRAELDERHSSQLDGGHQFLVQPEADEVRLNGKKDGRTARAADPDVCVAKALEGFENNAFILLVDDKQIETLEEPIDISENSVVTFLKLTPLVGG